MTSTTVTLYHDTRRKKANGLCPVKLQVFHNYERRYYSIVDLSKEDFRLVCSLDLLENKKGRESAESKRIRENKEAIDAFKRKAKDVIEELIPFSWDKFENKMARSAASIGNVFYYYDTIIAALAKEERIGTKSNYECSKKSIVSFLQHEGKKSEFLSFGAIDSDFLKRYEKWMLRNGNSPTTVGIYLRPLRAIFNSAVEAQEVSRSIYPFKKGKYQIPASNNIKKALSLADIKKLHNYKTEDENIIKARAFWFFSYLCNGINFKDILELKYKNVHNDHITFIRAKTTNTTRADQKTIVASMQPLVQEVILRYGNEKRSPETYVFPLLNPTMTAEEKHKVTKNFIRYNNQHIKKLAKLTGVDSSLSTYHARHSFSTISVRGGTSVEAIQKLLGHSNIKTTESYLASLDHEAIKKNAENLMKW